MHGATSMTSESTSDWMISKKAFEVTASKSLCLSETQKGSSRPLLEHTEIL